MHDILSCACMCIRVCECVRACACVRVWFCVRTCTCTWSMHAWGARACLQADQLVCICSYVAPTLIFYMRNVSQLLLYLCKKIYKLLAINHVSLHQVDRSLTQPCHLTLPLARQASLHPAPCPKLTPTSPTTTVCDWHSCPTPFPLKMAVHVWQAASVPPNMCSKVHTHDVCAAWGNKQATRYPTATSCPPTSRASTTSASS